MHKSSWNTYKGLVFSLQFFLNLALLEQLLLVHCLLLLQSLLLERSLHLVLVLKGLAPHLLLLGDRLFVLMPTHFSHLLLYFQPFLVPLQLQLHLVLCSPL